HRTSSPEEIACSSICAGCSGPGIPRSRELRSRRVAARIPKVVGSRRLPSQVTTWRDSEMTEEHARDEQSDLDLEPETVQDLEVDEESDEDVAGGRPGLTGGCGPGVTRYC